MTGLHYGTGNNIPTAMMKTVMLSNLLTRFQEWDPGVTFCVREVNMQEAQHTGYMVWQFYWVRMLDTWQQGVEIAVIGGHEDTYTVDEMYQHESTDEVYMPNLIMEYVIREYQVPGVEQMYESTMEVWDTGQQPQMDLHNRADENLVDGFGFFGWCTIF